MFATRLALEHLVKTILRSKSCKIDQCSCGAIHLSVGSTTVRITESAARELRDGLVQGLSAIDRGRTVDPTIPRISLVPEQSVQRIDGDQDADDDDGPNFH